MQKGGSSLFQSWTSHTEMLLPPVLCCMTCNSYLLPAGKLMYLPVSSCSGAVPPLNCANRDLWVFTVTFCAYSSVSPNSVYLNFGLDKTFSPFPGEREGRWLHAGVHYMWARASQELWYHQDCRPHPAEICLTWLALLSWTSIVQILEHLVMRTS